jgi:SAM domain (Sterile alpha motif)
LKPNTVPKAAEHRSSAMQQIAGWLDNLGMSEYAERFSENKIALRHRPGVMRTIEEVNKAMLAADYEGYSHAR